MTMLQIGAIEVFDRRVEFDGGYKQRDLGDITMLVIHHSGVDVDSSAEEVSRYHVNVLGWPGIGYHLICHWDGRIEYVGDILTLRYNVGKFNRKAIGILLPGSFMDGRTPNQAQKDAARALCANLQFALGWFVPIKGHRELMATACPGDSAVGGWLEEIRQGLEG